MFDKSKGTESDDLIKKKNRLRFPGEETDSISISDKATESVQIEFIIEHEQTTFQDLEYFLGRMRIVDEINFILPKRIFNFFPYQIPPSIFKVSDFNNALDKLIK